MEKLVRDQIPTILQNSNVDAKFRYVGKDECLQWLCLKLHEEADELREALSLDECADVFELLRSIAAHLGFSIEDVAKAANIKKDERGGFDTGCILIK